MSADPDDLYPGTDLLKLEEELAEAKAELADWHKYSQELAQETDTDFGDVLHMMKQIASKKRLRAKING